MFLRQYRVGGRVPPLISGCALLVTAVAPVMAMAQTAALPEGAGRTQFLAACSKCHEMSLVIAQGRTRDEWGTMISTMIDRGAEVPDEDFAAIQEYLARYFPAKGDPST